MDVTITPNNTAPGLAPAPDIPGYGPVMSVKEMGDLLGLSKTERYWLVHKNHFAIRNMCGRMWVDIASFEKWYANQTHYRKTTGETPGQDLKKLWYSVRDLSELLGVHSSRIHELIKSNRLPAEKVNGTFRIPREAFQKWYAGQDHYRKKEDLEKDRTAECPATLAHQLTGQTGISNQQTCKATSEGNQSLPPDVKADPDCEAFNVATSTAAALHVGIYTAAASTTAAYNAVASNKKEGICGKENGLDFITIAEAAAMADISRQAVSKHARRGSFSTVHAGRAVRISRPDFEHWLKNRGLKTDSY